MLWNSISLLMVFRFTEEMNCGCHIRSSLLGSLHEIQALPECKGRIAEPAESLNMYCLNPHMAASYRFFISCKSASNPWYSASWAYGSWRSIFSSIVSMKRPMMAPSYSFFKLSRS